jgi:hypothetical protein
LVLEMTASATRLTWFAGGVVILASVAIWFIARSQDSPLEPPEPVPAHLATTFLLAMPGLIGWIGALTGRRAVVVAAGVLCLFQSVIAFSGVTFVYLVPAIAMLRAGSDGVDSAERPPMRLRRVILAIVISIPIAFILVPLLGVFLFVPVALVAGLAGTWRAARAGRSLAWIEAARGGLIVLLLIGAWAATLALTESTCWIARTASDGGLVWERFPYTNSVTMGQGDVASSCSSGVVTPTGLALAALLLVVALVVAAVPAGGRRGTTTSLPT